MFVLNTSSHQHFRPARKHSGASWEQRDHSASDPPNTASRVESTLSPH